MVVLAAVAAARVQHGEVDFSAGLSFHCTSNQSGNWADVLGREYGYLQYVSYARQENVLRDRGLVSLGRFHRRSASHFTHAALHRCLYVPQLVRSIMGHDKQTAIIKVRKENLQDAICNMSMYNVRR